jgi:tubulin alpha
MREFIVIQLGTRGTNIGSSFWRQISAEHGIANNSFVEEHLKHQNGQNWKTFFHEQAESKITPRSIVVDLDSNGNDIPFAQYADHYDYESDFIIHDGRDNTSGLSDEKIRLIEEIILKQMERCDGLGQCLIIRDSAEATSHLLSSTLIDNAGLSKKYLHDFSISADRCSTDQQLVNTTFSHNFFNSHAPLRFIYQDVAIQRQVHSKNHQSKVDLNRFVANTLSCFTESDRFNNPHGILLSEIGHMDPYPSINYTVPSLVTPQHGMPCETDPLSNSLIANAMHNGSLLCDVDFTPGYYLRVHMFVRGLLSQQIQTDVRQLKERKEIRFVSWCPTGFKVGLSDFKYCGDNLAKEFKIEERSVCAALHNTSAKNIFQLWSSKIEEVKRKNDLKRLLTQNNIDEQDFEESFEALNSLILDYTEIEQAELPEDVDNE